ncbi:MAG: hypothetical protein WAO08_02320 [Hyphomicrobiaceae bacterium]
MRALVRTSPRLPSGFLLEALSRAFERTVGAAVVYMIEYRKAKAAEELCRHLARLSDQELAVWGLDRRSLAQFIRQRLY